mmetsp:Transcript_123473/g.245776  ORF Transcript_123473/g.245776 Transcript_123473/m.245776 type:complete len:209 (-) Transcript_123473:63-689(-)
MAQPHVVLKTRRHPLHLLALAVLSAEFCMLVTSFVKPFPAPVSGIQRSISVARLAAKEASELHLAQELIGTVKIMHKYGAEIDLGMDLPGFLHVGKICKERLDHPKEKIEIGQDVNVFVLKVKDKEIEVTMIPLEVTGKPLSEFHAGDEIEGKIEFVGKTIIFVDVGTYNSAVLQKSNAPGHKTLVSGQSITAKVLKVSPTDVHLTMK